LVSRWFGALWCPRVCRPWEVGVFLWDTQVFRCAVVYWLTGSEMVDQRLSTEPKILGNLSIVPTLSLELIDEWIEFRPVVFPLRHNTS
jgi:hypothetical protein